MMSMSEDLTITFTCPTVTAKVYVTRGPSGWPETFKRDKADQALAKLISPVAIADLVEVFVLNRQTSDNKDPTSWFTIVGFLGRTIGASPRQISSEAGIAFWGHVVLAMLASSNAN
jgi:hypothetical protein